MALRLQLGVGRRQLLRQRLVLLQLLVTQQQPGQQLGKQPQQRQLLVQPVVLAVDHLAAEDAVQRRRVIERDQYQAADAVLGQQQALAVAVRRNLFQPADGQLRLLPQLRQQPR
ncbi:hypothetical protein D3C85_1577780 [compost metagenome]